MTIVIMEVKQASTKPLLADAIHLQDICFFTILLHFALVMALMFCISLALLLLPFVVLSFFPCTVAWTLLEEAIRSKSSFG